MSRRYALVIDQERCIGCEACTVACKIENKAATYWIRVETQNAAKKDTPQGRFPDLMMTFLPHLCMHCDEPPCADACPVEAIVKREDGPVVLEEQKCDGCRACLDACPYDAICFSQEKEVVEKCNFCVHRIEQGLEPFCVVCCEGQAMFFGDLNDPSSQVSMIVADRETFQLNPEAETGPSVYYCPPKPRRKL
ncbi:MAG: 4Fe-4S dicluster domain-containing protein [Deltaproteobacteria bacterium]|nr:4Fe-4S dicluster domain-containing protein [Deltaproteobacteria bacterium]